jgi:DNA-binding transcriptional ArsR family regulator
LTGRPARSATAPVHGRKLTSSLRLGNGFSLPLFNTFVKYESTRGFPMQTQGSLDLIFGALADPTRRAIVARLTKGEATVNEIAEPFGISLPAISRHMKVLETAGVIARGREAQRRPCRLNPEAIAAVTGWGEHTRSAWEARLDRLEEHIARNPERPNAPGNEGSDT